MRAHLLLSLFLLFLSFSVFPNNEQYSRVIYKCEEMGKRKARKEEIIGKFEDLIVRNQTILTSPPMKRKTAIENLKRNRSKLDFQLAKLKREYNDFLEEVVRAGCPGVVLDFYNKYVFDQEEKPVAPQISEIKVETVTPQKKKNLFFEVGYQFFNQGTSEDVPEIGNVTNSQTSPFGVRFQISKPSGTKRLGGRVSYSKVNDVEIKGENEELATYSSNDVIDMKGYVSFVEAIGTANFDLYLRRFNFTKPYVKDPDATATLDILGVSEYTFLTLGLGLSFDFDLFEKGSQVYASYETLLSSSASNDTSSMSAAGITGGIDLVVVPEWKLGGQFSWWNYSSDYKGSSLSALVHLSRIF